MSTTTGGRVALVTGGGRGIGRAISLALAEDGMDVAVNYHRDAESAAATVQEIEALGRRAVAYQADVSSVEDDERMVASVLADLGHIDVLVNNAAAPHGADRRLLWEVPEEAWDLVLDVNLKGTFLMCRAAIPHMLARRSGRIVNMASVSGKRGTSRRGAYTASKFGVIGLTQALAQELAPHGITVNAICPGSVDTSRRESTSRRERALVEREPGAAVLSTPPTGRVARPDDIARLALFFASAQSDHITGQAWNVDGGVVMH
jgi:meso-butanediol dehydrogenase/(S,S)-butanediol dehydrogenase/diacetyl reductase